MSGRKPLNGRDPSSRFWRISAGGIFFQGGAAAVDSSTIIAALVHGLTGSSFAVGAAAAILRYGWLFPQLFVAYFAQRRRRRMPFYMVGAFGRATCLIGIAALLAFAGSLPGAFVVAMFFALWTLYAFVSGIVAVPYNDIVARSVPSARRSRLLAIRFFGGGLLALGVAAAAHRLLGALPFPAGTAAIVLIGAVLLYASSLSFVSAGEPDAPAPVKMGGFGQFLRQGLDVFRSDRRFRIFVYAQWLGGAVMMSLPFYILQVIAVRGPPSNGQGHGSVLQSCGCCDGAAPGRVQSGPSASASAKSPSAMPVSHADRFGLQLSWSAQPSSVSERAFN